MQKWKTDSNLHSCDTKKEKGQIIKKLDYNNVYINEFLDSDPLKDWESIDRCIRLFKFCFFDLLKF